MKNSELKQIIKEVILKELFDTKAKVKWRGDGFDDEEKDYSTTFTGPNNRKYKIELQALTFLDLPTKAIDAALEFMSDEVFDEFFDQGYHIEFGDTKEGKDITGLGGTDTAKVFGIVINAVIDKVKRENIEYFMFSAKEPSRKALYKKIAPLVASKLGYDQANDGTYFFLSKNPLK